MRAFKKKCPFRKKMCFSTFFPESALFLATFAGKYTIFGHDSQKVFIFPSVPYLTKKIFLSRKKVHFPKFFQEYHTDFCRDSQKCHSQKHRHFLVTKKSPCEKKCIFPKRCVFQFFSGKHTIFVAILKHFAKKLYFSKIFPQAHYFCRNSKKNLSFVMKKN